MDLGLDGQTITHHVSDYAMSVTTDAGFALCVENDYTFSTSTESWNVSPDSPADSERVPSLTNRTISSATTDQSGILQVSFTDGHDLTVAPDAAYEAWSLAGPGGRKVVCLPGGDLATWPAAPR